MRGKVITEAEANQILSELAKVVEENHEEHPSAEELLRDYAKLDAYIRVVKIDWHNVATKLNMEKCKVYTWYFNTHVNKVLGKRMTPEDKQKIKEEIRRAIVEGRPINKEFRRNLYSQLSTNYHTLEVSCQVTNFINSREIKLLAEEHGQHIEKLSKHKSTAEANLVSSGVSAGSSLHDGSGINDLARVLGSVGTACGISTGCGGSEDAMHDTCSHDDQGVGTSEGVGCAVGDDNIINYEQDAAPEPELILNDLKN